MAKTFYGYKDRRGANQVDWNGLATDASEGLRQIQSGREQQRKELDDINQSLLTAANEVEMGNNQTFNQFVLDGSAQTKEFLLMQNRLLKKGLLNPTDYSRSMQTVKDDWTAFSTSTKKLNEVYDDAMKRLADGTMAGEEAFKKEMLLKFANVQGKGIFVNPVDGPPFHNAIAPFTYFPSFIEILYLIVLPLKIPFLEPYSKNENAAPTLSCE